MREIERKYDIWEYLGIKENYNNDDIQAILEFVIFWNKIEKWQDVLQHEVIDDYINIKVKKDDIIDETVLHFVTRYRDKVNFDFDVLLKKWAWVNEKIRHKKCKLYITQNTLTLDEKIDLISYIIYRFRNRLLHWNKQIKKEQNENFIMINLRFPQFFIN